MIDNKLLTFIVVNETKNYTSAAKALNLTQPAVSQHIKQLEDEYNIKLFNRVGSEYVLTSSGEILLKYAKRIQSLYNDLERKIADDKKETKNLTIGITHTSESNIAPEILADYSSQKGGTRIRIISDSIRNLYDKLSNYQIDLAIIEGKITSKKYSSVLLDTDSLAAVISNDNALSKKKIVSLDDLKKERLILRNLESGTTQLFVHGLSQVDMDLDDFKVFLEIDNVATIKDLVKKNMGISILPRSVCIEEIKSNTIKALPIENINLMRETNLVYLSENLDREILEDIVSIYRSKIQSL